MLGLVFLAVKDWLLAQSSRVDWAMVATRAMVPESLVAKQAYEDFAFWRLIKASAEVLGVKVENVFEGAGLHVGPYLVKEGHDHALRPHRGSDVEAFLPYFKPLCVQLMGVTPGVEMVVKRSNSCRIQFELEGWPVGGSLFFLGVLKSLAGELCRAKDFVSKAQFYEDGEEEFILSWTPHATVDDDLGGGPREGLSGRYFNRLHPFHIMFDRECNIVQIGPSLQKLLKGSGGVQMGSPMYRHFVLKSPECDLADFRSMSSLRHSTLFTLHLVRRQPDSPTFVELVGQMLYMTSKSLMCFVCSPVITSPEHLKALELRRSDFSLLEAAQFPFANTQQQKDEEGGSGIHPSLSFSQSIVPVSDISSSFSSTTEGDGSGDEQQSTPPLPTQSAAGEAKEQQHKEQLPPVETSAKPTPGEVASPQKKSGIFRAMFQGARGGQERDKVSKEDRERLLKENREKLLKEVRDNKGRSDKGGSGRGSSDKDHHTLREEDLAAVTAAMASSPSPTSSTSSPSSSPSTNRRLAKTGSLPDVKSTYHERDSVVPLDSAAAAATAAAGDRESDHTPNKSSVSDLQHQQQHSSKKSRFGSKIVKTSTTNTSSSTTTSSSSLSPSSSSSSSSPYGSSPLSSSSSSVSTTASSASDADNVPETFIPIPVQSHYHSHFRQNRLLSSFIDLLLEDSWDSRFVLVKSILQIGLRKEEAERTQLFEAVSVFYSAMGKFPLLLAALIEDDLNNTPKPAEGEKGNIGQEITLFREESVGVRLFITFLNLEASYYLQHCTGPLLEALHALPKPLELNPMRVSEAECEANAAQLLELCQSFLAHVCRSSDYCPPTVRRAFSVISFGVARHMPEMYLQSIANLLFLRFLSPAIVTPKPGQLRTAAEQRTLTLVSKSVYSLMNNVLFGEKEPFMTPMNAFISTYNVNIVQQFMRDLVDEEKLARVIGHKARTSGRTMNDMATVQYKSLTSLNDIKKYLLAYLPQLWPSSCTNLALQTRLQRLLSVSLCDIVSEMSPS